MAVHFQQILSRRITWHALLVFLSACNLSLISAAPGDLPHTCSISMERAPGNLGNDLETILDINRVSHIECALHCLNNKGCTSIQFSALSRRCLIRGPNSVAVAQKVLAPNDAVSMVLSSINTVQNTCPDGFIYIGPPGEACIKPFHSQQTTRAEARQFCRNLGSGVDLVATETDLKFSMIGEMIDAQVPTATGFFWMGGQLSASGSWTWLTDGEEVADEVLERWYQGEPQNAVNGQDCMQYFFSRPGDCALGCLVHNLCQTEAYVICEHRPCHA